MIKKKEMIKILIEEIKEIKEENKEEKEKVKELIKLNEEKEKEIKILGNNYNNLKEILYELDDNIKGKYRDEINLKYITEEEGYYNIFGEKFVEINKDNIELDINGEINSLIDKYKLKKGKNNIKIKIKSKMSDLQCMFYECNNLKKIDELKYLNTKYCNNFSYMFYGCSSLSDIKGLENWNVFLLILQNLLLL